MYISSFFVSWRYGLSYEKCNRVEQKFPKNHPCLICHSSVSSISNLSSAYCTIIKKKPAKNYSFQSTIQTTYQSRFIFGYCTV